MDDIVTKLKDLALTELYMENCDWVDVTHINNPHDFYVRKLDYNVFLKDLEEKNEILPLEKLTNMPVVIYKSKIIGKYVRGRVQGITKNENQETMCTLFALDYGCEESIKAHQRLIWSPMYKSRVKPLAMHCKLYLCSPIEKEWTNKAISAMKNFIGDGCVQIRICEKILDTHIVMLYAGGPDDVATLMMYSECSTFRVLPGTICKLPPTTLMRKEDLQHFKIKKLHVGDKLHVRVLSGSSLDNFHVATVDDYRKYRQLTKELKMCFKNLFTPCIDDIVIGKSYGVYIIGENSHERGIARYVNRSIKEIDIYLVDRGHSISVPPEHLKVLNSQIFFDLCTTAIACATDSTKIWDNGLNNFLYPGYEFKIVVKCVNNNDVPNLVDVMPLN